MAARERTKALFPAVLTAALLLTGCEGRSGFNEAPIRLLDPVSQGVVEWPELADERPTSGLTGAGVEPREAGESRVVRVLMHGDEAEGFPAKRPRGHEERLALLAPTPTTYRFPMRVPRGALLEVGLGYVPPPEEASSSIRFEVVVEAGDRRETLLDELLEARHDGEWLEARASLAAWAGEDVTLVLHTSAEPGQPVVWGAWAAPEVSAAAPAEGWDVILVSLDTLRADHLGCYGYHRPTSPRIDSFAADSVRFELAVSQSPWTRPSHQALFTGIYPLSKQGLESPPLAKLLWQAGYRTRAVTSGGWLHYSYGFSQGFEEYRIDDWLRSVDAVAERFVREPRRRQFLFLHTYEIHDPFTHTELAEGLEPGRIGERFSNRDYQRLRRKRLSDQEKVYIEAMYDSGIRFTDDHFGALIDALERGGALDRTIIILTSDHGEQFFEHGSFRHGRTMYDHDLLVPLIVYLPPGLRRELGLEGLSQGAVIAQQVRLIDIYPTVLDLLGIAAGHGAAGYSIHGRSLRALLEGGSLPEIDAFAEGTNRPPERKALRSSRFKFVQNWETKEARLYDLRRDPGERYNLAAEQPEVVEALAHRLAAIAQGSASMTEADPSSMSPELREQLEALGYLGDSGRARP